MPNDSETNEKTMIHFSWRSRSNCQLLCEANQGGLEHSATITVGLILQSLSVVAVICCDAGQHVHSGRG
jgi:hypothetical protein